MDRPDHPRTGREPATWLVVLAFGLLYTSWSTTFFAIRIGVNTYQLPAWLFAGVRVLVAGVILLAFLAWRDPGRVLPSARDFLWTAWCGILLFVGGNGLMTVSLERLPSGTGAVFTAATPLWLALMEALYPPGDKLPAAGWAGLLFGLVGVGILIGPEIRTPEKLLQNTAPLILLGSTVLWALGSLTVRYKLREASHLAGAAWQMIIGGTLLVVIGLARGEGARLGPETLSPGAIGSFVYLVIVGSLIGFTAFNWLLMNVRATLVGTYAYVNPVLAVLLGCTLGKEELTVSIICGMIVILTAVALVRAAGVRKARVQAVVRAEPVIELAETA
jgi:drug/metabolite transporter (DMT)-like permease